MTVLELARYRRLRPCGWATVAETQAGSCLGVVVTWDAAELHLTRRQAVELRLLLAELVDLRGW